MNDWRFADELRLQPLHLFRAGLLLARETEPQGHHPSEDGRQQTDDHGEACHGRARQTQRAHLLGACRQSHEPDQGGGDQGDTLPQDRGSGGRGPEVIATAADAVHRRRKTTQV